MISALILADGPQFERYSDASATSSLTRRVEIAIVTRSVSEDVAEASGQRLWHQETIDYFIDQMLKPTATRLKSEVLDMLREDLRRNKQ